jgi:hypothetical protein
MCVSPIVARQRLGIHVPAAANTRNDRRTVGRVIFYAVSVSYQSSLCVPLSLLYNSIKAFPRQRRIIGGVLYAAHAVSNESNRLVLSRTSCFCLGLIFNHPPQRRCTSVGLDSAICHKTEVLLKSNCAPPYGTNRVERNISTNLELLTGWCCCYSQLWMTTVFFRRIMASCCPTDSLFPLSFCILESNLPPMSPQQSGVSE